MRKKSCSVLFFLFCAGAPLLSGCSIFDDSDTLTVERIVKRIDSDRLLAHSRANPQESPFPEAEGAPDKSAQPDEGKENQPLP